MEKTCQPAATESGQISEEVAARRRELFDKYVTPNLRMVYKLCVKYSFDTDDVQDNYVDVLTNMYRYIETYNPDMSIQTWLHIVTKRQVYDLNQRNQRYRDTLSHDKDVHDMEDDGLDDAPWDGKGAMTLDNYRELYSDDVLYALDQLKPQHRRALLLQQAGYRLKEIAEIEYANGALVSKNIETVKSRLFIARHELKKLLTRDGRRRTDDDEDQDAVHGDTAEDTGQLFQVP